MASVRRTSVAGTWYPDNPARLVSHVDGYLERARIEDPAGRLRAIVVPHAGLMYSGPVAAYAYNVARRHRHSALVLVGPSHFVPFHGVSIWPDGEWETPLGPVPVDRDAGRGARVRVVRRSSSCRPRTGASTVSKCRCRSSRTCLPDVPIVPMVMGHQTRETAFALGAAIAPGRRSPCAGRAARGEQRSLALRGREHRGGARSGRHRSTSSGSTPTG